MSQSPLSEPLVWDLVTDGYVSEIVPQFEYFANAALDLAAVSAGQQVVDVASGPGTLAFLAAQRGARVSAIDFSERMIEALRERARREGVETVDGRVGDGMALPYADARFDAAFSMFGLMFFPDRARGFAELARVLRPGGRVVISSWQPMDRIPLLAGMYNAIREVAPQAAPPATGKPPLLEPSELHEELRAGGFGDVDVRVVTHTWKAPTLRAWWESALRSNAPLVAMKQKIGDKAFALIAIAVYDRLVRDFGDGPQQVTLLANLGTGTR